MTDQTDMREAFEAWFNAVELGDGDIPLPTPNDGKRWDDYVLRHALALGAWKAALQEQPKIGISREQIFEILRDKFLDNTSDAKYWNVCTDAILAALASQPKPAPIERERLIELVKMAYNAEMSITNVVNLILAELHPSTTDIAEVREYVEELSAVLTRLRDCDWVISLPDRMDAVRDIAREALSRPLPKLLQEG